MEASVAITVVAKQIRFVYSVDMTFAGCGVAAVQLRSTSVEAVTVSALGKGWLRRQLPFHELARSLSRGLGILTFAGSDQPPTVG